MIELNSLAKPARSSTLLSFKAHLCPYYRKFTVKHNIYGNFMNLWSSHLLFCSLHIPNLVTHPFEITKKKCILFEILTLGQCWVYLNYDHFIVWQASKYRELSEAELQTCHCSWPVGNFNTISRIFGLNSMHSFWFFSFYIAIRNGLTHMFITCIRNVNKITSLFGK